MHRAFSRFAHVSCTITGTCGTGWYVQGLQPCNETPRDTCSAEGPIHTSRWQRHRALNDVVVVRAEGPEHLRILDVFALGVAVAPNTIHT